MTKIQIYITFALLGILTVLQIISVALLVRQDGALQPMSADARWGYEKKQEFQEYTASPRYEYDRTYSNPLPESEFPNEKWCANPDQPC